MRTYSVRERGGRREARARVDDARSHARTHRKETVGRSCCRRRRRRRRRHSVPGQFHPRPSLPLPLPASLLAKNDSCSMSRTRPRPLHPRNPPPAPPTQTDGSSSHYDAALHTSREATAAAAAAVRNSCVAPVNILRWRPTVQGGERGDDDGKDETILSCRAPRSDAT